ncbi:MAG: biopolymer transporter ExbD [Planctomycetota bacterium]
MNFRQVFEERQESFQIAPLIDIVFLLLIFFILNGVRAQEAELPMELPRATASIARRGAREEVVVNVARSGTLIVDNAALSVGDLRRSLRILNRSVSHPISVVVRAHPRAQHQYVLNVLDACAAAGITNVSFVTKDARTRQTS